MAGSSAVLLGVAYLPFCSARRDFQSGAPPLESQINASGLYSAILLSLEVSVWTDGNPGSGSERVTRDCASPSLIGSTCSLTRTGVD